MTQDRIQPAADTRSTAETTPKPLPSSAAPGHYGAGYGDPAKHFGDDAALPGSGEPASVTSAGTASGSVADATDVDAPPVLPGAAVRPDFTADEIGLKPPTRSPSEDAPASENVSLNFERS